MVNLREFPIAGNVSIVSFVYTNTDGIASRVNYLRVYDDNIGPMMVQIDNNEIARLIEVLTGHETSEAILLEDFDKGLSLSLIINSADDEQYSHKLSVPYTTSKASGLLHYSIQKVKLNSLLLSLRMCSETVYGTLKVTVEEHQIIEGILSIMVCSVGVGEAVAFKSKSIRLVVTNQPESVLCWLVGEQEKMLMKALTLQSDEPAIFTGTSVENTLTVVKNPDEQTTTFAFTGTTLLSTFNVKAELADPVLPVISLRARLALG